MPRKDGNKHHSTYKYPRTIKGYNNDATIKKLRKELIGKPTQKDRN